MIKISCIQNFKLSFKFLTTDSLNFKVILQSDRKNRRRKNYKACWIDCTNVCKDQIAWMHKGNKMNIQIASSKWNFRKETSQILKFFSYLQLETNEITKIDGWWLVGYR